MLGARADAAVVSGADVSAPSAGDDFGVFAAVISALRLLMLLLLDEGDDEGDGGIGGYNLDDNAVAADDYINY